MTSVERYVVEQGWITADMALGDLQTDMAYYLAMMNEGKDPSSRN